MKNVKYFLFILICMFCSSIVLAKDEITIEKMIPVYDENSGVIVSEENGIHSVIFNDKDQNVKFNIVLRNNTKRDISLKDIVLPESPEEFFKYEFVGIDEKTILEPDSTEEVVLSLETVKTEGWGRNFTLDLTSKVEIMDNVVNPNTSVKEIMVVLVFTTFVTGILVIAVKNRRLSKYIVLLVMFSPIINVANAKDPIILPIKLNVSFESQNVMKSNSCEYDGEYNETWNCDDIWMYNWRIMNFYFENEFMEIQDYAYKFDVSEAQNEKVIAYLVENKDDSEMLDLHIQADGIIYANEDASFYFAELYNLKEVVNFRGFDTSLATDMSYMFFRAGSIVTDFNFDLSSFDTSNVTDMSYMFYDCDLELDLRSFNTSNVTNMKGMFAFAGYHTENLILDLSSFDTSNVTNMSYMFEFAGYESDNFTLDLSSFDTSNVTDMSYMFERTGYNNPNFTLDVSNFDTSNVTIMDYMFSCVGYNNTKFTLDVSRFDTSNVISMRGLFHGAGYSSENFTLDVSGFDTSKVTDMFAMFSNTGYNSEIFELDTSNFDTRNVIGMRSMFEGTGYNSLVFTLDVSNFDTSNVIDMRSMFEGTGYNSLVFTLDVSGFDTSNVTDMSSMFERTGYNSEIFDLDTSNFDMSKVKEVGYMFSGAGYNSTMLNTSITINKNNFKYNFDYWHMFEDVAIKPGTNITVNYTSATSSLVDNMIATRSSGSNVVKGVQVD